MEFEFLTFNSYVTVIAIRYYKHMIYVEILNKRHIYKFEQMMNVISSKNKDMIKH